MPSPAAELPGEAAPGMVWKKACMGDSPAAVVAKAGFGRAFCAEAEELSAGAPMLLTIPGYACARAIAGAVLPEAWRIGRDAMADTGLGKAGAGEVGIPAFKGKYVLAAAGALGKVAPAFAVALDKSPGGSEADRAPAFPSEGAPDSGEPA
mmetsp:Transcript_40259/g.116289  ORF Transcript_40259/g.116289 Transcript_40259/m.116289 type:complete len:151 (-) Transcript_40259:520-972(-)